MITESEKAGYQKALLQSWLSEHNAHMPAVVTGVNADDTVEVRFAIQKPRMQPNGSRQYETSEIHSQVPVMLPSCGGFSIDIPISVGCKGYVHHSDLDHDNFFLGIVDGQGVSQPHTARYHSFNDIVFEPAFNGGKVTTDCLQLRSNDTVLKVCDGGFDVEVNGDSLIDAMAACCSSNAARIRLLAFKPLSGFTP